MSGRPEEERLVLPALPEPEEEELRAVREQVYRRLPAADERSLRMPLILLGSVAALSLIAVFPRWEAPNRKPVVLKICETGPLSNTVQIQPALPPLILQRAVVSRVLAPKAGITRADLVAGNVLRLQTADPNVVIYLPIRDGGTHADE